VNNQRWTVVCLCLITGFLNFSGNAQADPVIKLIERSHTAYEKNAKKELPYQTRLSEGKEVSALMLGILKSRLSERMSEMGLISEKASDLTPLYRTLETEVTGLVEMGLWGESFSPFRLLTSHAFLDGFIADWVGIPMVASQLDKSENLGATITSNPSRLYVERAEIVEEIGGDGAGNGRLDHGEWAAISLNLKNGSSIPWFSTSIYVTVNQPNCAWVNDSEIEPGEFLKNGSEVQVPIWVYVSPMCPEISAIQLIVTKVDSHRTAEPGISSVVRIPVERKLTSKIVDLLMDTDVPGESSGHQMKIISPDTFSEISHGVRFSGRPAVQVEETLQIAKDQMGLFITPTTLESQLSITNGTHARAGDDLDLKVIDKSSFLAVQGSYRPSKKFMSQGRGELWFAADMVVATLESMVKPGKTGLPKPALQSRKSKNMLSATQALNLVKKHLIFESREMQPKAGAIAAVTGHDVLIDKEAFEKAWNAQIQGTSTKAELNTPSLVYYKVRRFFQVPMFYDLKAVAAPKRTIPKQKPQPKPKPVVEKETNNIIDIGGGGLILPSSGNGRDDLTITAFTADWFIGKTWTFMGHLHSGSGKSTDLIPVEASRLGMALGAGYKVANSADTLHFHPHIGLGFTTVEVKEDEAFGLDRGEFAAVLNLGTALRLMPTKYFGFHVAMDVFLTNVDNDFTGIVYTGVNTMFAGGITLRF